MSQQSLFQFLKMGNLSTTAFNRLDVSIFVSQPKCFPMESKTLSIGFYGACITYIIKADAFALSTLTLSAPT